MQVQSTDETNKQLNALAYVMGGLSFIPLFGVPFGIVAIVWGVTTKRSGGKKLALLGGIGVTLTLVLYGSLIYFGFFQRGGIYDDLRKQMAQGNLTNLVQAVEFYKIQHGGYPESLKVLQDSLPKDSMVFINDPTDLKFSRYFYYERTDDDHYYLRGVGADGVPFTSDDILPQIQMSPGSKSGLLIEQRPHIKESPQPSPSPKR